MKKYFKFLNQKSIPKLFWSSEKIFTIKPKPISLIFLCSGLAIFGFGEAILIRTGIGVSPWTVLAEGLTNYVNWTVGFATFIISVVVLLCWIPLKQTPGIGTIMNAIIVAIVIDLSLPIIPDINNFYGKLLFVFLGIIITGFGGSIYLISNLGPGPRDGLMTGMQKKTNLPLAWVRSLIEITAVMFGWLLGGTFGIGTIFFALGIGPSYSLSIYTLNRVLNSKS